MPHIGAGKEDMKANRKFVQADDAVSPVIAVILMVAITVVLAATVFVLVSDIGGQTGKTAPAFSLSQDEATDRLTVSSAANNADWNRLSIRSSHVTGAPSYNLNADSQTAGAPAAVALTVAGADLEGTVVDLMGAGEYIDFCGGVTATDVKVTLTDVSANQIMGEWLFATLIVACGV